MEERKPPVWRMVVAWVWILIAILTGILMLAGCIALVSR